MNLMPLNKWREVKNDPFIISGPCSAETKEQVLVTAKQLKANGINIFRAGIWKPRTRPNSFEGIGSEGLLWLKQVKKETGMLIAVEVANEKHVTEALRTGVDVLWIGARTSVSPFAVQEIADSLKGVDIPILVKNPINPDLELWLGAIERINKAGITKIAGIHRGFSTYESTKYRNVPNWQIPIELKRRVPELPIICDPSHIGGTRELIEPLCQKAMDLGMDGLMIESHCNPFEAWSDAKQQITPETLMVILKKIIKRKTESNCISTTNLDYLRHKIDQQDKELLNIIGDRMLYVEEIGKYKKENEMTILQSNRWESILKSRLIQGEGLALSNEIVKAVFKAIHQESISKQENVFTR